MLTCIFSLTLIPSKFIVILKRRNWRRYTQTHIDLMVCSCKLETRWCDHFTPSNYSPKACSKTDMCQLLSHTQFDNSHHPPFSNENRTVSLHPSSLFFGKKSETWTSPFNFVFPTNISLLKALFRLFQILNLSYLTDNLLHLPSRWIDSFHHRECSPLARNHWTSVSTLTTKSRRRRWSSMLPNKRS